MNKEIEEVVILLIFSAACTVSAILGARLRNRAEKDDGNKISRDKLITRLYLAGGAGLVTALIGNGLHINKSLTIGTSIVIGYAGGKKFFTMAQRIVDALAHRKLRDINRRDSDSTEHLLSGGDEKKDDNENNDAEIQSYTDRRRDYYCSCLLDCQ